MKAMRLVEPSRPLLLEEVGVPRPGARGVLVKVEACGVCHTDLHLTAGFYDLGEGRRLTLKDRGIELPRTLGHEIAGRIEQLGEEVLESGFRRGDSVAVYPWVGCGSCRNCRGGLENLCEVKPRSLGIFADGGYAEYVVVPDVRHLVSTAGVKSSQAALLTCSGITSLRAVKKSGAGPGSLLVTIGAGGLGTIGIQLAKKLTGTRVATLDIDDAKLRLASEMGADYLLNTRGLTAEAVSSAIREFNDGRSADIVIDFVGSGATFSTAFQILGRRGRLVSVGLYGGVAQFPLPILTQRGLEIIGNYTGTFEDLSELVQLVRRGVISPVISETVRLGDVNVALDKLRSGDVRGRIVVNPSL